MLSGKISEYTSRTASQLMLSAETFKLSIALIAHSLIAAHSFIFAIFTCLAMALVSYPNSMLR